MGLRPDFLAADFGDEVDVAGAVAVAGIAKRDALEVDLDGVGDVGHLPALKW